MGTNFPTGAILPILNIFHSHYFVETGTGSGATLEIVSQYFRQCFSCDINQKAIDAAIAKNLPNVDIRLSDSLQFLAQILPGLEDPIVYWLDAHWCGGICNCKECPLLAELSIIGSLRGKDVIFIDDVNFFLAPPPKPHKTSEWPTIYDIISAISSWGAVGYSYVGTTIVLAICPREVPELLEFANRFPLQI